MRVRLKGIHRIESRGRYYYYAWRGGPRLSGKPGTPQFMESYHTAHATRKVVPLDTIKGLVADYKSSAEYTGLATTTRRDYSAVFKLIEEEFGDMPTAALKDTRSRGIFKKWRDQYAETPRKADRLWSVLKRVFSHAVDNGALERNPCSGGGRLYKGSRVSSVWTRDEIELVRTRAPFPIWAALSLAINTGQRQGDLLSLLWSNITENHIQLTQAKTGKAVSIRISQELRITIDELKRQQSEGEKLSTHILTNTRGRPWTSDGFKTSWGKAVTKAEVTGRTFHDLRGTAVTRWAEAGATVPRIAALSGHSLKDVEGILEKHYLSMTQTLGDQVILGMDQEQNCKTYCKTVKTPPEET